MGIRTKIVLFMLLLLSATVSTLAFSLYYTEKHILERAEYKRQMQIVLAWTQVCRETAGRHPDDKAAHYFEKFFPSSALIENYCIDSGGKIYLSKNSDFLGKRLENVDFHLGEPVHDLGFTNESFSSSGRIMLTVDNPALLTTKERILARLSFSKKELRQEMDIKLREAAARIYGVCAIALIVGCIGILFLTAFFSKPIQMLITGVRLLGAGQLDREIPLHGKDEFSMLATEINLMAARLRELDEMKRDFTSGITHDLRSPVTGIKLCAINILDEYKAKSFPKIPEQTLRIMEYAERLNRFIDSLLEVARIESQHAHLRLTPGNLEEIAARVVESYRPYAQQKKLQLNLVVEHELCDIQVDVDKLEQAISNVVGNAIKYTETGLVAVYVGQGETGQWQEIRVVDTGRGIVTQDQAHIFDKFHGIKEAGKGTGLGLYIAKSLLALLGGTIECRSEPGKGSSFTLKIPVSPNHETQNTPN